MNYLVTFLLLVVFVEVNTAQLTGEDQCLSICAESWPDTRGPIGPPGPVGAPGISGPVGRQGKTCPNKQRSCFLFLKTALYQADWV